MRDLFLKNNTDKITNKNVLVVACGKVNYNNTGMIPNYLQDCSPKNLYLTDLNDDVLDNVAKYYNNVSKLDALDIESFSHSVDTVISTGFLYRTAHPLLHIQQLASLNPAYIYFETINIDKNLQAKNQAGRETQKLDIFGYWNEQLDLDWSRSSSQGKALPYAIQLPHKIYIQCLKYLGYTLQQTIDNSVSNLETPYGDFFRQTTGYWLKRQNEQN